MSTPPGRFNEQFSNIGSPANDGQWDDVSLAGYLGPRNSVVEIALVNKDTGSENEMGVRGNGSPLGQMLALHEGSGSGADAARMHVPLDGNLIIEFYHTDVSDPFDFLLIGSWGRPPPKIILWREVDPY